MNAIFNDAFNIFQLQSTVLNRHLLIYDFFLFIIKKFLKSQNLNGRVRIHNVNILQILTYTDLLHSSRVIYQYKRKVLFSHVCMITDDINSSLDEQISTPIIRQFLFSTSDIQGKRKVL